VQAKAEADAAELRATAVRVGAEADAAAKKIGAAADAEVNRVRAEGEMSFNEATNKLSKEQTDLVARRLLLEALPGIIRESARPMENIDRISVIDARGLQGATGGSDGSDGQPSGSLADSAVSAAMRYRVGAPLIDSVMAEIGMKGGSLDGLMAGVAPAPHAAPASSAATEVRASAPRKDPEAA